MKTRRKSTPRGDNPATEPDFFLDIVIVRAAFVIVLIIAAFLLRPFNLSGSYTFLLALASALVIVFLEHRLRRASLKRLIGGAVGSILGILGAFMINAILSGMAFDPGALSLAKLLVLSLMVYVGLVVGANKGQLLNLSALGGVFGAERTAKQEYKILDTSVIIDGRISDICDAGFLDGVLVIPHFVLRELQQVADSPDSLKRNRGRRGLDILQKIRNASGVTAQFVENDYPDVADVDMKLIELARDLDGKIVTNDFNLNKVAQLRGVQVLNINELANALKPIYLPGESMKVFILKGGKEFNQGVAYLDDGTMVVVDNARKLIGKTVETSVTSVLQTTAGKMIFGRYEEKREDGPRDERSGPERAERGDKRPAAGAHAK